MSRQDCGVEIVRKRGTPIRTILLTVAPDPLPLAAARRAAWLARITGARIVLLHVAATDDAADWETLQQSLLPVLEGASVTPVLAPGNAARQIEAVARQQDADLIMLTRHPRWLGEGGRMFHRFLLHSVLARTIQDAACPVWIESDGQGPPLRRLVCAIQSLVRDRDLAAMGGRLAEEMGAALILFRNAIQAEVAVPGRPRKPQSWQQELVTAVEGDLEKMGQALDLTAQISVGIGAFLPTLLAQADAGSLAVLRRTSAQWKEEEFVHDLIRGAAGPVLICPDLRRPRAVHLVAAAPPRSRLGRMTKAALTVLAVLIGFILLGITLASIHHPDECQDAAYRCSVRENIRNSAQGRPLIQPKDVPRRP